MVNAAFGTDKLITPEDGHKWLYKNKEHGKFWHFREFSKYFCQYVYLYPLKNVTNFFTFQSSFPEAPNSLLAFFVKKKASENLKSKVMDLVIILGNIEPRVE